MRPIRKFNISKSIGNNWKVKIPIFGKIFFLLQEEIIILKNDLLYKLLTYISVAIRHKMNHQLLIVSLPKTDRYKIYFLTIKICEKDNGCYWPKRINKKTKAKITIIKGHEKFSYWPFAISFWGSLLLILLLVSSH